MSQPTIDILQRTNCRFEYEMRGETYLKVKRSMAGCQPNKIQIHYNSVEIFTVTVMPVTMKCLFFLRAKAQRQLTG